MGSRSSKSGLVSSQHAFADLDEFQDQDESLALVASMLADDLKRLEDQEYAARVQLGVNSSYGDEDEMIAVREGDENGGIYSNEVIQPRQQLERIRSRLEKDRRGRRKIEGVESNSFYARRVSQEQQLGVLGTGPDDDDALRSYKREALEE